MSGRVIAMLLALVVFITVGMYFSLKRSAGVSRKALQETEAVAPVNKTPPKQR